jgi:hypothetical protein
MKDKFFKSNIAEGWDESTGIILTGPAPVAQNPSEALQHFRDFYRENREFFNEVIEDCGVEEVLTASYLAGMVDGSRLFKEELVKRIDPITTRLQEGFCDDIVDAHKLTSLNVPRDPKIEFGENLRAILSEMKGFINGI